MKELHQFFILINNMSLRTNPSNVCVSLKDKEGKIIKKIEENALLPDKNFRDLSGLYIGLKEAENFGVRRVLILTDNSFLGAIIKTGLRKDYMDYKEVILDKLERIGLTDIRKHIVYEHVLTPIDIQKMYYSNAGSIYGVVSDLKKNFAFKLPKKSKKYKNLYFVGGSVNPGGGMPMVLLSGQNTCKQILKDDK